ncbi:hypothetical protein CDAR_559121 [Caerostris darwini]|uniref:Uncharacterized protein n=1 Tax=Caerostris darwini TaxID=1538125 RepID=A0AAV4P316_9ARAC|nr:hypothetical protein CDAR_559121 [Caerostris darwini]
MGLWFLISTNSTDGEGGGFDASPTQRASPTYLSRRDIDRKTSSTHTTPSRLAVTPAAMSPSTYFSSPPPPPPLPNDLSASKG